MNTEIMVKNYLDLIGAYAFIKSWWKTDEGEYFLISEGTTETTTYALRVKNGIIYNSRNENVMDYVED